MIRDFKLLLLGSCCLAVTACAAPNREPDLSNIKSNVNDQTREGDFGDFLYNLVEAEDKAREASDIKASLDADAPYLYTNLPLRKKGVQLSEEALDHRKKAEAALNRILDPIRARLAYLESLHVPQDVGPLKASVYFATGSSRITNEEAGKVGAWSATSSASIRSRTSRSIATPTRRVRPAPTRNWPVVVALRPSKLSRRRAFRWPDQRRDRRLVGGPKDAWWSGQCTEPNQEEIVAWSVMVAPHGTLQQGHVIALFAGSPAAADQRNNYAKRASPLGGARFLLRFLRKG